MANKKSIRFVSFTLVCLVSINQITAQSTTMDTVMARIKTKIIGGISDNHLKSICDKSLATMQKDGSWSDINYGNPIDTHLSRIKNFATAYTKSSNQLYKNDDIYNAIVTALQFWVNRKPVNTNWWYNDISYPQSIGEILIVMNYSPKPLPTALRDTLLERMKKGNPYKQTGANKSDEALHYLYRACVTHNKLLMDSAIEQAFQPITILDGGEGIQYDNSYFQHGTQLAIGSYGPVFTQNSYNIASYLSGTAYALKGEKLGILSNYVKNTFLKTIRGQYIDFNVLGRGISRPNLVKVGGGFLDKEKVVDPTNNTTWNAATARMDGDKAPSYAITPSHTHFFRGDYDLHIRPGYSFNIRTNSVRTKRTEMGNGENWYGRYLPDGATDIQVKGGEYYNIMPVWEWDKIPGTTNRDYPEDRKMTEAWGQSGNTNFVGGVSDSLYGATVYDLDYDSVKAKKAWFFFDDEVVCLGAGITSNSPENITTTINQCWLDGDVTTSGEGKTTPLADGENLSSKAKWVMHGGVGYFLPAGGNTNISNTEQRGNWYHINNGYSTKDTTAKVFKLWLNHGAKPANAGYAYIVAPGKTNKRDMENYPVDNIRIISNSTEIQAVHQKALDILQIVFYKSGTFKENGITVTVDEPCILMVKNVSGKKPILYIADPAQANKNINISLQLPSINGTKQLVCNMPLAPYLGKSIKVVVE